ncbi:MAG: glycosyltransferase family 4 protein [Candidatus Aminicenantes bacterium]|nr:glycosyltransferase family 4 protein [Candidatus Aminicenantes bacterium]
MIKRIGFISTRIAGTDGVTLETKKWAEVLKRNGYELFYLAGELDVDDSCCMQEELFHFKHPEILEIQNFCFGRKTRPVEVTEKIHSIKEKLKKTIQKFIKKFDIDLIIPENVLAIPLNIPLGLALTEYIAETGIPTIAHHHDFYWERERFLVTSCLDYLSMAFPPLLNGITNVVINTLALQQVTYRKGMSAVLIPNVYDYETPPSPLDEYGLSLREKLGFSEDDLFILQPTRIVPRKQIEKAIDLVALMKLRRPALVISHSKGDEGDDYFYRILWYAEKAGVELIFIEDLIEEERDESKGTYTLWDVYKNADLITYPSGYEGFGNAFLEAVYFKKLIFLNRYSIYIADLEPLGFDVVAFEGFVTQNVVENIYRYLKSPALLENAVEKNYSLARKNFSYEVLERRLIPLVESYNA